MAKILSRPMFRKGGSANNGIMHGLVDRKGYAQGDNPYIQEAKEAFSTITTSERKEWAFYDNKKPRTNK